MLRWVHPGDFVKGLLYPLRGLEIMRRHGGLRRYWVPPIVLTGIALIASVVLSARFSDDLLALIWQAPVGDSFWTRTLAALHGVAQVVVVVLGFAVGLVVTIGLASVIAAPFNDALSEAVELRETGQPPLTFSMARLGRDVGRTVRIELLKLLVYASVLGRCCSSPGRFQAPASSLTPPSPAFHCRLPRDRLPRLAGVATRLSGASAGSALEGAPMMTLGFGVAVTVCLFVPLLNLFFMPMAVAGGTRLFLDLMAYGERSMNGDVRPPSER